MEDKKRVRKKQLYHDIVKQVEFYFSSANLSKDRFMSQALAENGNGLELSILLTFNKLKALTTDINTLKKALKLSERLELTENETRIKSNIPYTPKENVDECTIYVERLPLDANQDFLRQIFSPFGDVDYVSVPKFPNGKIKGFAFIEFASPAGAEKTIEEFIKTDSYLPIDMAPGNLRSICTFDKKTKDKLLRSKTKNEFDEHFETGREFEDMSTVNEEVENVEIKPAQANFDTSFDSESDDNDKKRKQNTSPSVTLDRQSKKIKSEDANDSGEIEQSDANSSCDISADAGALKKMSEDMPEKHLDNPSCQVDEKVEKSENNIDISDPNDTNPDEEMNRKVKKKRRQKKKSMKKDRPTAYSGLLILSKSDWKKLRNKYLTVQWEKMKSLKKHLHKCKEYSEMSMDTLTSNVNNGKSMGVSVDVSNSVVKVILNEPVVNLKEFKAKAKSLNESIMNVDIKEGSTMAHIRFSDADSARKFIQNDKNIWNCRLISGVEEEMYWIKIHRDRQNKRDKQIKCTEKMEEDMELVSKNEEEEDKQIAKGLKVKPTLTIVPGLIVKIQTSLPISDVKHYKNDLKSNFKDAVYVDVQEGGSEVFIRFNSAENAVKFSSQASLGQSSILSGKEELAYWDKINEDRTNKFNRQIRVNRRGKQKIIQKAENLMGKHIIFEDLDV